MYVGDDADECVGRVGGVGEGDRCAVISMFMFMFMFTFMFALLFVISSLFCHFAISTFRHFVISSAAARKLQAHWSGWYPKKQQRLVNEFEVSLGM